MSDVVADEKKQQPNELKANGRVWNEKVTLKRWEPNLGGGPGFMKPYENVWAVRQDTKKGLYIKVYGYPLDEAGKNIFPVRLSVKSIITDAAGNVYEVVEAEAGTVGWVKLLKPAPKKKP